MNAQNVETSSSFGIQGGLRLASVDDVTEFGRGLEAWEAVYEQLSPGRFEGRIREIWVDEGLEILWELGSQSVWTAGCNVGGVVSFGVPMASGGAGLYYGVPLDDGVVTYLPGGGEFEIFCRGAMDMVSATVSEKLLQGFASADSPQLAEVLVPQPLIRQRPQQAARLRRALTEIVRAVERHPDLLRIEASRKAMRDCVLAMAVETLDLGARKLTCSLHPSAKAWIVRSVREYALDRPKDPLNISDLCQLFRVSRRSLQYAFEDLTGMGAVQFLRNVRLNAVRRDIRRLTTDSSESIANIAARWGFWHLPRFAEYYRTLFGELPSETRQRVHGRGLILPAAHN
ncbi:helix-turn-helix domain-containing protein [Aromatoleum bremense]|uniref:Helix-turn-helix domain-containing protein n=1 Tax=Aromatoleum bremense TaxID=76115 RepID=A0ABX1NYB3_9RHOO|nr:helix-turn-helix domain-containing protein [Aromatoleum bremense]NMG17039.1 helix-turn-helix domain-containing protein [Aromatoleum bremense]